MTVSARDVVSAYRSTREGSSDRLLERLRSDPAAAHAALEEVIRTRRGAVRAYAGWLAARTLPKDDAVGLLLRVAGSRDPDVRDSAITDLIELDVAAVRSLLVSLRRDLARRDEHDVRLAIWTLAKLGDVESLPRLREIAERLPDQHVSAQSARLAALVLERDVEAIRARQRAGGPEDPALIDYAARIASRRRGRAGD